MCDEIPSREEMIAEILARPEIDQFTEDMFAMLARNAERRIELMAKAYAKSIDENGKPKPINLTRKHGFMVKT
jgi:hypothetical protein